MFESETEETDVMNRPPRQKEEGVVTGKTLVLSPLQGFVVLSFLLRVYISAPGRGFDKARVRTLTVTMIVMAILCFDPYQPPGHGLF